MGLTSINHDDVIKWQHFPQYWPFVRRVQRSSVDYPHKDQCRWGLMFSLIYAGANGRANNPDACDLRRHHAHYDVTVMCKRHLRDLVGHLFVGGLVFMVELMVCRFNTLRLWRNGHFVDDIFKRIFFITNVWVLIKMSLKLVSKGPINNIPALVQIMAWRRPGAKPLPEPMMASFLMHMRHSAWMSYIILFHTKNDSQMSSAKMRAIFPATMCWRKPVSAKCLNYPFELVLFTDSMLHAW